MMNAMFLSSGLSHNMWREALFACYILIIESYKKLDRTPYELWKGYAPNLNFLRVWGCLATVWLPMLKRENISPKTFDSIFIGYAQNSAIYRFISLNDFFIYESRVVEIFGACFSIEIECLYCCAWNCTRIW